MKYIKLGQSNLKVSQFCLGTLMLASKSGWRNYALDFEASLNILKKAVSFGINFIDTANIYSQGLSEEFLGQVLPNFFQRDKVILATKVGQPMKDGSGLSKKYLINAAEDSLKRLKTDYIDLYIIHRWDYKTPIEETLEGLNKLVIDGKVRYLGASSMFAWQFCKILEINKKNSFKQFITMQNHYNLIYREEEREMLPLCNHYDIAVTPFSPLARGFLTGKRNTKRYKNDELSKRYYNNKVDFKILNKLISIAKDLNTTPQSLAISWLMHKPCVKSIILGPSKLEHLDIIKQLHPKIPDEHFTELERYYIPKIISGHK